jgi:hypothetical protein
MILNIYNKSVKIFEGENYLKKKIIGLNLLYLGKNIEITSDQIINGVRVVHTF